MKFKNIFFTTTLAFILFNTTHAAQARSGSESGNGGDVCEDRIKVIRDDLRSWIQKNGADALQLPGGVSLTQYKSKMTDALGRTRISCVDSNVAVQGVPKTCINYRDPAQNLQIRCNLHRLSETAESDQYVLIHHEYAGAAGLEVNDDDGSHYPISNQISDYLVDQVVKRLAVKAMPTAIVTPGRGNLVSSTSCRSTDFTPFVRDQSRQAVEFTIQVLRARHPEIRILSTQVRVGSPDLQSFRGFYGKEFGGQRDYEVKFDLAIDLVTENGTVLTATFQSYDHRKTGMEGYASRDSGVRFHVQNQRFARTDAEGNLLQNVEQCQVDGGFFAIPEIINKKYGTSLN